MQYIYNMKKYFKLHTKDAQESINKTPAKAAINRAGELWQKASLQNPPPYLQKIIHSSYGSECRRHDAAVYTKQKDNLIYIVVKADFDTCPHPMLPIAEFAYYKNGFWVVAYSEKSGQYMAVDKPITFPSTV